MTAVNADPPFFDTSYLVRLYLEDAGFDRVRQLASSVPTLAASWHAQAEVMAALHRAYREGRFAREHYLSALNQFDLERCGHGFVWHALTPEVLIRLEHAYRAAPATTFLRAADALHLACATVHGYREVYSHDRQFLAAAPLFDLQGINILTPG
ncbi:MAG: PIN domain-containing protein [Puniceicoccaceae bacterium]|nr:MAG: PIN domain-containing protein [Puniceicoccaceae bacterium]